MNMSIFKERLIAAFENHLGSLVGMLPMLLSGLVIILVGYLLAKLVRYLVQRLVRTAGIERMAERQGLERTLSGLGGIAAVAGKLVFWLVLLFFMLAAAEVMELTLVTDGMRYFFAYLPKLLSALAVFLLGLWLAQKARSLTDGLSASMGIAGGRILGRLFFGIIVLFMGITALNVAGLDTTLITSNILLFFGGMLVAFSVAYGMASRDILTNILSSYYGKERFLPGQRVRIGADEGEIVRIDSIAVTLRTSDRTVLIPASKLITERIEVLSDRAEHPADR